MTNKMGGRGPRRGRRGYTLIEVMIVMAIVAIGLMIAIPNFQRWMYHYNAVGFVRDVYSEFQEARTRAASAASRHRIVVDLGSQKVYMQQGGAGGWTASRRQIQASSGATIGSVVPTPGTTVTASSSTPRYALVFNPSGEVYGQSDIADDNTIAVLTQALIQFPGRNPVDNASITVFGWTGKARLN